MANVEETVMESDEQKWVLCGAAWMEVDATHNTASDTMIRTRKPALNNNGEIFNGCIPQECSMLFPAVSSAISSLSSVGKDPGSFPLLIAVSRWAD